MRSNRPVYYNEFDPGAVAWLRNNIDAGLIAYGHVDSRSIKEVTPDDVRGYAQVHLFAGIGGWSVAARLAGWHDARPLWSASCPCQPFSAAGLGAGTDDPRHLWPDVHRLKRAARPPVIVGEQVAGAAGYGWFDGVRADLEAGSYASRVVDIPACAVDSPQQRQRLYWVAVALEILEPGRPGGAMASPERADGRGRGLSGPGQGQGPAGQRSPDQFARPDGDRVGRGRTLDSADAPGREGLGRHGPVVAGQGAGPHRPATAPDDGDRPMVDGSSERWGEGRAESGIQRGRDASSCADAQGDVADDHDRGGRLDQPIGGPEGRATPAGDDAGGPVASADSGGRPRGAEHDQREEGRLESPRGNDPERRDSPQPEYGGSGAPGLEALDSASGVGWAPGGNGDGGDERDFAGAGNQHGRNGSWWSGAEWIFCHDTKARRVADASAPLLVDGVRGGVSFHRPNCIRVESLPGGAAHPLAQETRVVNRVAAWSGFGNAISPVLAAEAIGALMDILPPWRPE